MSGASDPESLGRRHARRRCEVCLPVRSGELEQVWQGGQRVGGEICGDATHD